MVPGGGRTIPRIVFVISTDLFGLTTRMRRNEGSWFGGGRGTATAAPAVGEGGSDMMAKGPRGMGCMGNPMRGIPWGGEICGRKSGKVGAEVAGGCDVGGGGRCADVFGGGGMAIVGVGRATNDGGDIVCGRVDSPPCVEAGEWSSLMSGRSLPPVSANLRFISNAGGCTPIYSTARIFN
jgi:hypothetical protein